MSTSTKTLLGALALAITVACGDTNAHHLQDHAGGAVQHDDAGADGVEIEEVADTGAIGSVEALALGQVRNVHRIGALYVAGQPGHDDLPLLRDTEIELVVSLRRETEPVGFDEAAALEELGIAFENPAFGGADELTDELFDRLRALLVKNQGQRMLLHCGSAHRVASVWLPYRVLDQGVALDDALEEAHTIGLRPGAHEDRAIAYVEARR